MDANFMNKIVKLEQPLTPCCQPLPFTLKDFEQLVKSISTKKLLNSKKFNNSNNFHTSDHLQNKIASSTIYDETDDDSVSAYSKNSNINKTLAVPAVINRRSPENILASAKLKKKLLNEMLCNPDEKHSLKFFRGYIEMCLEFFEYACSVENISTQELFLNDMTQPGGIINYYILHCNKFGQKAFQVLAYRCLIMAYAQVINIRGAFYESQFKQYLKCATNKEIVALELLKSAEPLFLFQMAYQKSHFNGVNNFGLFTFKTHPMNMDPTEFVRITNNDASNLVLINSDDFDESSKNL